MSTTFTEVVQETFHVVSCYTCGVRFGIDARLYRRVVTNAEGSVFCPACGGKTCWRDSEATRKIRQLEQKLIWEAEESARLKAARDETMASLNATRAVITRMKSRARAGLCQCCNRTFQNLQRHMATKHPETR